MQNATNQSTIDLSLGKKTPNMQAFLLFKYLWLR